MNQKNKNLLTLTVCSTMVALASALSLVKVWQMPLGGAVTLFSMLPIVMISCMFPLKWSLGSAFVYSLIQLAFGITMDGILGWGLTPLSLFGTIFLDYLLPFTLLGFGGIFKKKGYIGIVCSTALVIILRFLCHFVSGIIIFDIWCEWSSVPLYSLCYNGAFMLPELIITVIGASILFASKPIKKMINLFS